MATSSTYSTACMLAMLVLATFADAGTTRRLLDHGHPPSPSPPSPSSPSPSSPSSPSPSSPAPSPIATPVNLVGLPYVYETTSANMVPALAPLAEAIFNNRRLFEQVLNCSKTVGIPEIASEFGHTVFDAIYGFKAFGFCALVNMTEQKNRMTYQLNYAGSLFLKSFLLQDYECPDMSEMPVECYLHEPVTDAVEDAISQAYTMNGQTLLCSGAGTGGGGTPIRITTLPTTYEPVDQPKYNCSRRPDTVSSNLGSPASPSPSPASPSPAPASPSPAP